MKTIKINEIRQYFKDKNLKLRHDAKKLKYGFNRLAREEKIDPWDLFYLVIENKPMTGTHSYGFHTRYGRHLIDTFSNYYYNN